MKNIGVQLYTVREVLPQRPMETFKRYVLDSGSRERSGATELQLT